ncbi:MAG TPA: Zn-ribbon domain-containing OB-fold protein [Acidimicrobiales bacterium]|nr:Zn-ribbon domain-containing OB-fold protein [Acidimicrobiales bacterium]
MSDTASGPVTHMAAPMKLDYIFTPGVAQSKNLHGLEQGKFIGQRCPKCKKVYTPSRGACPVDGVATDEIIELPNTGTVTTYCVVNVPFAGQSIELPYICAQILLDGANIAFMGLIQEIPAGDIRMGLRVEAVWVAPEELGPTMASVKYFRPSGEPDAAFETYKEYL